MRAIIEFCKHHAAIPSPLKLTNPPNPLPQGNIGASHMDFNEVAVGRLMGL